MCGVNGIPHFRRMRTADQKARFDSSRLMMRKVLKFLAFFRIISDPLAGMPHSGKFKIQT